MLFLILLQYTFLYISAIVPTPTKTTASDKEKQALRYGFHKTAECQSFENSYLCIQKCLDLNYDIAYTDKNCACTCYFNKEKAKYSPNTYNSTRTKWKLGAPTTSIPAWAQDNKEKDEQNPEKDLSSSGQIDIDDLTNVTDANSTIGSVDKINLAGTIDDMAVTGVPADGNTMVDAGGNTIANTGDAMDGVTNENADNPPEGGESQAETAADAEENTPGEAPAE